MEEKIYQLAQDCIQKCPAIILGSGASITHGIPSMENLAKNLCETVKIEDKDSQEQEAWMQIKASLENGEDLETVLENNEISTLLLEKIIYLTWKSINKKDSELFYKTVTEKADFSLGKLLSILFNSSCREVDIITTNYDRVAEYACNSENLLFQTTFNPGYISDWQGSSQMKNSYIYPQRAQVSRLVKIWKVHGSLDWFETKNERILGLPVFKLPSKKYELKPLIVTPGLNKYRKAFDEPFRAIISKADEVLESASAFICIGFGFRDHHIYSKLRQRCRTENIPVIVLAKKLTNEAKRFLLKEAGKQYLGIEESDEGCTVYADICRNGQNLSERKLWQLSDFVEEML